MASTFSDLKIELIGTGEQVGTWGSTTNINLGTAVEEAIVGSADVSFSSADVTVTLTNSNGTQAARHLRLNLTGTSGGARQLILGSGCQIEKPYIINNGLADAVTVKNTAGTGVVVPAGKSMWVFNNSVNVVEITTHTPVSSGGTGASTLTANNVIIGNGTSAVNFVAPGALGNVLISNGTTWTSGSGGPGGDVTLTGVQTLINKTIAFADNTLTDVVGINATQTLTNKTITSPEFTGAIFNNGSVRGNVIAVVALDIDCTLGNYFTKTISANSTFTFSSPPASRSFAFTLELTHTSGTVTWPAAVKYPNDAAPVLANGKTSLFIFVTDDGGTRWRGAALIDYTT